MERSSDRASNYVDERAPTPGRLVDRLVATALVTALTPESEPETAATRLADLADGRLRAIDRARSQILRSENGRPTKVTSTAAAALLMAHTLEAGRLRDLHVDNGSGDG